MRALAALMLSVSLLLIPANASAVGFTGAGYLATNYMPKVQEFVMTHALKVSTAFQQAAVQTVNLDGLMGGGLGAGVQKLAEPKATTLTGMGWGFVYGTNATFLWNFCKELRNEYQR